MVLVTFRGNSNLLTHILQNVSVMFRATFVLVRASAFLGALLLFLLARLFIPGEPFGPRDGATASIVASASYSICAGIATFLTLFGTWTYQLQTNLVRLRVWRLLLVRVLLAGLGIVAALVLAGCLVSVGFARVVVDVGALVALVGLLVAFLVKGHRFYRPAHA